MVLYRSGGHKKKREDLLLQYGLMPAAVSSQERNTVCTLEQLLQVYNGFNGGKSHLQTMLTPKHGVFGSFGRTHFFIFPSMRSQGIIQSTSSNNHKTNHALGSTRENQLKTLPDTACPKPSGLTDGLLLGPWESSHRIHACCTESNVFFRVLWPIPDIPDRTYIRYRNSCLGPRLRNRFEP